MAAALPLNGTCVPWMPATWLNSSPDRCGPEPMPTDAKLTASARCFAQATSSFTDFAGTLGEATSTLGAVPMRPIGVKSRTGYCGFSCRLTSSTNGALMNEIV
jgi:hypothetical protein